MIGILNNDRLLAYRVQHTVTCEIFVNGYDLTIVTYT